MTLESYFVEFTGSGRESEDNSNLVLSRDFSSLVRKIKLTGQGSRKEFCEKRNTYKMYYFLKGKKSRMEIIYLHSEYSGSEIPLRVAVYNKYLGLLKKTLKFLNETCENGFIRKTAL